jgi:hypothetical protein
VKGAARRLARLSHHRRGNEYVKVRTALGAAALAGSLLATLATAAFAVTIDSGTQVSCALQQQLDSKTAHDGDTFTCTTTGLADASGQPIHGTVYGHLSEVTASSYSHKAHLKMNFDRIQLADGTTAPIDAALVSVDKKQNTNALRVATEVLGSMIAGNIVGKAIGTNLGGVVGTGAGILYAANTASDVVIPQYANVKMQLNQQINTRRQASY